MGRIFCKKCKVNLGNIEGSIHKDITYLCTKCEQQRIALELRYHRTDSVDPYDDSIFNDFKDIFNS